MVDEKKAALQHGLYIVATPIGNLGDVTRRAIDVLENVDVVLCEDTRVTGKLMQAYGLKKPLLPYHDHNADKVRPEILKRLGQGEKMALVSDAGTPLISDPGYKLVKACHDAGIFVTAIPGPSSVMTALVLSGLPTDRFMFVGFLPEKTKGRTDELKKLVNLKTTLVCFESVHRLAESLADMASVLGGGRQTAIAREMTKMYEEVRRGRLDELAAHYKEAGEPKGEVVIVIGPPLEEAVTDETVDVMLKAALGKGMSVRDASDKISEETGRSRKDVYARALQLKNKN